MGLEGKIVRLASSLPDTKEEIEGLDFEIVDKIRATHYGNAGDDEYIGVSVKSGRIALILPVYLKGATILPGDEQK